MLGRCCLCAPITKQCEGQIFRWARFDGPQATESLNEDTAWTNADFDFSRLSNWGYNESFGYKPWGVPENGYCVTWDPTSTPTGTNAAGNSYWEFKMHPMRIKADSFSEAYHGKAAQFPSRFGDPVGSYFWHEDQYAYLWPTAPSSTTLGENSHAWPMTVEQIRWPMGLFWQPGYSVYTSDYYDYLMTVELTHYRVLIGGTAVTDIVELDPATQGDSFGWKIGRESNYSNAQNIGHGTADPVDVTSGQYNEQTIEIDYWLRITVTENPFVGLPSLPPGGSLPSNPGAEPNTDPMQILWCEYANFGQPIELFTTDFAQQINFRNAVRVTFADNGPDDATYVNLKNGNGWSIEEFDRHIIASKTLYDEYGFLKGEHRIFFVYCIEIPVVTLQFYHASYPFSANITQCIYWPEDSLDYDAMNVAPGLSFTPGVWDPTASTTFVPVAIRYNGDLYWNGSSEFPTDDPEFIPRFPSSITLS